MPEETAKQRQPDTCPNHPESRAYRTEISKPEPDYTLIQYSCAAGCATPLGWEYHAPDHIFQHGAGQCANPEIIHTINLKQHWEKAYLRLMETLLLTVLPTTALVGLQLILIQHGKWTVPYTIFTTAVLVAGSISLLWTLLRKAFRQAPKQTSSIP